MKTTSSSMSRADGYNTVSAADPIVVALALFLVVIVLRYAEIFVPGLNTLPDKSILSKILGFLVVLVYLWILRKPIRSIGLHTRNFDKAFFIGGVSLVLLYGTLYALQFYRLSSAGETSRLVFGAINPESATMGGLFFTLFYIVGQVINAFMEEGIFRGMILPHFMRRFHFLQANILQAFLFGLAHLVWPLNNWLSGKATSAEASAEAVSLLIATTVGGLVFGYLYYRTNSLWTAIFAHLIDNSIGLFFHIQTVSRLNAERDILMLASVGFIALTILAWTIAKRSNLPTLRPWGTNDRQGLSE